MLLLAIAGLALVPVLVAALTEISVGSLVIGTGVSWLLERGGMKELRAEAAVLPVEATPPA